MKARGVHKIERRSPASAGHPPSAPIPSSPKQQILEMNAHFAPHTRVLQPSPAAGDPDCAYLEIAALAAMAIFMLIAEIGAARVAAARAARVRAVRDAAQLRASELELIESAFLDRARALVRRVRAEDATERDELAEADKAQMLAEIELGAAEQRTSESRVLAATSVALSALRAEREADKAVMDEMLLRAMASVLAKVDAKMRAQCEADKAEAERLVARSVASVMEKVDERFHVMRETGLAEHAEVVAALADIGADAAEVGAQRRAELKADVLRFVGEEKDAETCAMDAALLRLYDDYTDAFWTNTTSGYSTTLKLGLIRGIIYDSSPSDTRDKPHHSEAFTRSLFPESAVYARSINSKKGLPGPAMLTNQDMLHIMKRVLQKICIIDDNPLDCSSIHASVAMYSRGHLRRWTIKTSYQHYSEINTDQINRNIWEAAPIVHLGKIYIKITYGNFDEIHIDPTTAANYQCESEATTGGPMVPITLPEA